MALRDCRVHKGALVVFDDKGGAACPLCCELEGQAEFIEAAQSLLSDAEGFEEQIAALREHEFAKKMRTKE